MITEAEFVKILTRESKDWFMKRAIHLHSGNRHDAEDLCQETMFNAYKNRDLYTGLSGDLKNWFASIMKNLYVNDVRAKKMQKRTFDRRYHSVGHSVNEGESVLNVDSVLGNLNPLQQMVITLMSQGYKQAEIAKMNGYSHQYIKDSACKARKILKNA